MSTITSAGAPPDAAPVLAEALEAVGADAGGTSLRTFASASAPSSRGDQRSGFGAIGGASPVSASQLREHLGERRAVVEGERVAPLGGLALALPRRGREIGRAIVAEHDAVVRARLLA